MRPLALCAALMLPLPVLAGPNDARAALALALASQAPRPPQAPALKASKPPCCCGERCPVPACPGGDSCTCAASKAKAGCPCGGSCPLVGGCGASCECAARRAAGWQWDAQEGYWWRYRQEPAPMAPVPTYAPAPVLPSLHLYQPAPAMGSAPVPLTAAPPVPIPFAPAPLPRLVPSTIYAQAPAFQPMMAPRPAFFGGGGGGMACSGGR